MPVQRRHRGGAFPIPSGAPAIGFREFTIEAMMLRTAAWQEDVAVPGSPALKFSLSLQSEASLDPSLFRLHEKNIGFRFRFTVEYYGEGSDSLEKTGSTRLCPNRNSKQYQGRLALFSEKILSSLADCTVREPRFLASGQLIA